MSRTTHSCDSDARSRRSHDWPAPAPLVVRGSLRRATRPVPARRTGGRGFSIVELAVSLGIFVAIAALITVAISRSLAATTAVRADRVVEQALAGELAKVTSHDYPDLLAGTFTVPDACTGVPAGSGVAGTSCVRTPAGALVVGYRYQRAESAAAGVCTTGADPGDSSEQFGFIGVCARLVSVNGLAADQAGLAVDEQYVAANAPTPGYRPDQGTVRIHLDVRDAAAVAGRSVFVVRAADPRVVAGSATVTGDLAYVAVPATGPGCPATDPCSLALSPTWTPNTADGLVLAAAGLPGPGDPGPGPSTGLVVTAGDVTDAYATIRPAGTARLHLVAAAAGSRADNPDPGSVCLWATFADGPTRRTVPACNTTTADHVDLATYQPLWHTDPASPLRYAYPVGVPITLSVDHPDGVCYYAPGMRGSVPAAPGGWADRAVCTSYTWGTPGAGLDAPVTLTAGSTQVRDIVWSGTDGTAAPATGYPGQPLLWVKPRAAPGCSRDATCAPVPAAHLEAQACPVEYCLAGGNAEPVITTPAPAYYLDPATDPATDPAPVTRTVTVRDPEGDPVTVTAAAWTGGDPADSGVQVATDPDGPWTAWAAGTVLTSDAPSPVRLYLRYTRSPGDTGTHRAAFTLADDAAPAGAATGTVALFYDAAPDRVEIADVTVPQGGTVTAPYTVFTAAGDPAPGVPVTRTAGTAPAVTLGGSTSGADGRGELPVTAAVDAAAGTYTYTVAAGDGLPATLTVTVTPTAGSLALTAAGAAQGQHGTATATVLDRAGDPMPGVLASFGVTRDGDPARYVYPTIAGCSTGADGTCTVDLAVESRAPAGEYLVAARSGTSPVVTRPIEVTATPAHVRVVDTDAAVAVRGTTSGYRLLVTDAAGDPVPDAAVTHPDGAIGFAPDPGRTGPDGQLALTATVGAGADLGPTTIPIQVAGVPLSYPLRVTDSSYQVAAGALVVRQDASSTATLTVRNAAGAPAPAQPVTFSTDTGRLGVAGPAVTDADGHVVLTLTGRAGLAAGPHTLTVTVAGQPYPLPVTVTQVATTLTLIGQVDQGVAGGSVQLLVTDAAGAPVPDFQASLDAGDTGVVFTPTTVVTDAAGAADLTVDDQGPTAAGSYPLHVTGADLDRVVLFTLRPMPKTLTVTPAAAAHTDGASTDGTVRVLDYLDQPLPDLTLTGTGLGGGTTLTGLDAAGAELAALPATDTDGLTRFRLHTPAGAAGWTGPVVFTPERGAAHATLAFDNAPGPVAGAVAAWRAAAGTGPFWFYQLDNATDAGPADPTPALWDTTVSTPATAAGAGVADPDGYTTGSRSLRLAAGQELTAPVPSGQPGVTCAAGCTDVTVGLWVRPQPGTGVQLRKGATTPDVAGFSFVLPDADAGQVLVVAQDGTGTRTATLTLPAAVAGLSGRWTHLVCTLDAENGAVAVWLDGTLAATGTLGGPIPGALATPDPVQVGGFGAEAFAGRIDDLGFGYTGLTGAQIADLARR